MERVVIAMVCAGVLLAAGCSGTPSVPDTSAAPARPKALPTFAPDATVAHDSEALERLKNNAGVTLQWISWERRGTAWVREEGGVVRLTASQTAADGPGRLTLDGLVTEIGADYFIFAGRISIVGTPDANRRCETERSDWRFAVTQNRPYWRLREFEWCDGLTDYIDIYLPGTRP